MSFTRILVRSSRQIVVRLSAKSTRCFSVSCANHAAGEGQMSNAKLLTTLSHTNSNVYLLQSGSSQKSTNGSQCRATSAPLAYQITLKRRSAMSCTLNCPMLAHIFVNRMSVAHSRALRRRVRFTRQCRVTSARRMQRSRSRRVSWTHRAMRKVGCSGSSWRSRARSKRCWVRKSMRNSSRQMLMHIR